MDYVSTPLFLNQEIPAFQPPELPQIEVTSPNELIIEGSMDSPLYLCRKFESSNPMEATSLSEITAASTQASRQPSFDNLTLSKEEAKKKKELKKLDTWKSQLRFGDFVKDTKIMPCKVFLCEPEWLDVLAPSEQFTLVEAADHFHKLGLKIGLVLDLNRSTNYYTFDKARGDYPLLAETKFYKFKLEQGAVPTDESIEELFKLLKEGHESGDVILVHCYNGINRTGYIICEFLCQFFGINAEMAIKNFEEARKYKIEHACLVNRLHEKYPQAK